MWVLRNSYFQLGLKCFAWDLTRDQQYHLCTLTIISFTFNLFYFRLVDSTCSRETALRPLPAFVRRLKEQSGSLSESADSASLPWVLITCTQLRWRSCCNTLSTIFRTSCSIYCSYIYVYDFENRSWWVTEGKSKCRPSPTVWRKFQNNGNPSSWRCQYWGGDL